MISALREKTAEAGRLASAQADLERRFADYQTESGAAIRGLQDREAQLVAEGALAIDRSFRPIETERRRLTSSGAAYARPNTPPED